MPISPPGPAGSPAGAAAKPVSRHHAHRTEWQWARDDDAEGQRDASGPVRKGA